MQPSQYFDKQYYDRFYRDKKTFAVSPQEAMRRAEFFCAYLKYLDLEPRSALDIGCGLGQFKPVLQAHFPRLDYHGVEHSDYLCETYGWKKGSVVDFCSSKPTAYDIVICYDVAQYLDNRACAQALENLAALTKKAMLFGVLTKKDWDEQCDQQRTDSNVYVRTGRWYKRRLSSHFNNVGGGVFVKQDAPVVIWEIESLA